MYNAVRNAIPTCQIISLLTKKFDYFPKPKIDYFDLKLALIKAEKYHRTAKMVALK